MGSLSLGDGERAIEEPRFTRHADGRVTIDHWPQRTAFDLAMLYLADPQFLKADEGGVSVKVANGTARYQFTGGWLGDSAVIAELGECAIVFV